MPDFFRLDWLIKGYVTIAVFEVIGRSLEVAFNKTAVAVPPLDMAPLPVKLTTLTIAAVISYLPGFVIEWRRARQPVNITVEEEKEEEPQPKPAKLPYAETSRMAEADQQKIEKEMRKRLAKR